MHRAISEDRDRLQSRLLVVLAGAALLLCWALQLLQFTTSQGRYPGTITLFFETSVLSLTFAGLVWALRAGTPAAALSGAVICSELILGSASSEGSVLHSELSPLVSLFVLTYLATKIGKRRRTFFTSTREIRHGRSAAQVIANLSAAPLAGFCAARGNRMLFMYGLNRDGLVLALAALIEATADTVSSELGQVFGGQPYLLTTWKPVAPGTDGAVSLLGTGAGVVSGALIAGAGAWALQLSGIQVLAALVGGIAGLMFDSLLGATVERRGWLNNDLVNFSSTVFAAVISLALLWLRAESGMATWMSWHLR